MLLCFGRRKLATLLTALCLLAMLMSINKYLSSDNKNSSTNGDDQNSKAKAYYPFDDTGQLRNHQHLNIKKRQRFKAWQMDEDKDDFKNAKLQNVIQAPMNDGGFSNNKAEHEVIIRDFNKNNDKDDNYAFQNVKTSVTTNEDYIGGRQGRIQELSVHGEVASNNKVPAIEIPDSDVPVFSPDGQRYIPRHRVVHLDFKGAPPLMKYLKSILPLLKEAGATALLVEYEDMFPYWGRLKNIAAKNAYTIDEVTRLQRWAEKYGMIVIPLVQTFGHLEHALKLADFYDLREVSAYPQSVCPSRNGSWQLVTEMIDQITQLHPESKWLHIGCDEVFQLGMCSICTEKLMKFNSDPEKVRISCGWKFIFDTRGTAIVQKKHHALYLIEVSRFNILMMIQQKNFANLSREHVFMIRVFITD